MNDKSEKKLYIRFALGFGLAVLLFFWLHDVEVFDFGVDQIELDFEGFALASNFVYEMFPNFAKQFFSVSAIGTQLLIAGFSPVLLGIILATGQTVGQMGLYFAGMLVKKTHAGSFGKIANSNHFFHQHHFLIYLAVPFFGVAGDGLMLLSGHQRINPLKIIPFLFIANLADNYKWVYQTVAQLEISNQFT